MSATAAYDPRLGVTRIRQIIASRVKIDFIQRPIEHATRRGNELDLPVEVNRVPGANRKVHGDRRREHSRDAALGKKRTLVDGYGQVLGLVGSSATSIVDPKLLLESEALQVSDRPDIQALPPRFTSPARLWFRYMDASGDIVDATPDKSPVCGYLMPDHLDGALEFFDADGNNLGVVRPDPQAGVLWEEAPGQPSTVGQSPSRAIPNQFLAGIAQGLLLSLIHISEPTRPY